jgi:hypothetical protein
VEEDEATEEFFDEVSDGLEGAVAFLAFEARKLDAEGLGEGGIPDEVIAEAFVVLLVGGEEFVAEFLDGEGIEHMSERRLATMAG